MLYDWSKLQKHLMNTRIDLYSIVDIDVQLIYFKTSKSDRRCQIYAYTEVSLIDQTKYRLNTPKRLLRYYHISKCKEGEGRAAGRPAGVATGPRDPGKC